MNDISILKDVQLFLFDMDGHSGWGGGGTLEMLSL